MMPVIHLSADYMDGNIQVTYRSNVIDLRPGNVLNRSADGQETVSMNPSDLKVGSVFIDPNGDVLKVTDIYEAGGKTVIETTEPEITEAFTTLDIPDFEFEIGREDISWLGDGVTLLAEEESLAADGSRMDNLSAGQSISFHKVLYSNRKNETLVKKLEGKVDKRSTYKVSRNIEVVLDGTATISSFSISGYYKSSKAKAEVNLSQSIDATITGTATLLKAFMYPLYGFTKQKGNLKLSGGVYLLINIFGEISLEVKLHEDTSHKVGASTKNALYVPYKISPISEHTYNVGYQPSLSADAYIQGGPYFSLGVKYKSKSLASASLWGGLKLSADGFIGAENRIGRTNSGTYGSISSWIINVSAKLEAFLTAKIKILGKKKTLFSRYWTLKEWSN